MTNAPLKVHCRGIDQHKNRPICGKKLPDEFCVSRKEFQLVSWKQKCQLCARTKFARFI